MSTTTKKTKPWTPTRQATLRIAKLWDGVAACVADYAVSVWERVLPNIPKVPQVPMYVASVSDEISAMVPLLAMLPIRTVCSIRTAIVEAVANGTLDDKRRMFAGDYVLALKPGFSGGDLDESIFIVYLDGDNGGQVFAIHPPSDLACHLREHLQRVFDDARNGNCL